MELGFSLFEGRRHIVWLILVAGLGAVWLGYGYFPEARPSYITAPVERGSIATIVKATGTVNAKVNVDVSSQLSGRVAEVLVDFNDHVKAGQPIARLDPESYAARVNQARALLKVARSTVELNIAARDRARAAVVNAQSNRKVAEVQLEVSRIKHQETERQLQRRLALARTGNVTESELTRVQAQNDTELAELRVAEEQIKIGAEAVSIAEAEMRMAESNIKNAEAVVEEKQATLEQAEVDLGRTTIRAPIDGILIKRDINPGQTVAVSLEAKTIFKIVNDLAEIEVHARMDEADIGRLKVDQPANFTVDAYPDQTFVGKVAQIRKAAEVVQNVVTYPVIIAASNPELLLFPGMTALVRIVAASTGNVLKVPNQALRFAPDESAGPATDPPGGPERATVWVHADNGKAVPVVINPGPSDGVYTAVLSGDLQEGQQVIIGTANSMDSVRSFGLRIGG